MKTTKHNQNLSLDKSSIRQLIVPFVASILIVIVIFVGIVPGIMAIDNAKKKLAGLKTVSSSLSYKADTLENLDTNSLSEKVDLSVAAIPLTVPYQNSLQALSTLLTKGNLTINNLSVKKSLGKSVANSLVVEIDIESDYQSIKDLLTELQKITPLVAVKSVELTRSDKNSIDATGRLLADISLNVYFSEPPKTIGKTSDQLPAISADFEKALQSLRTFTNYKFSPEKITTSTGSAQQLFP